MANGSASPEFTQDDNCFDTETCGFAHGCAEAITILAQEAYGAESHLDYLLLNKYKCKHAQGTTAILQVIDLLLPKTIIALQADGRLPTPLPGK